MKISVFDFMPAASIADVQSRTASIDQTSAFRTATAALWANGGGKLVIGTGTYLFTFTTDPSSFFADTSTFCFPSNTVVECEPGVVFNWNFWGSPLFAIVNQTNVKLKLNGALFHWTGGFMNHLIGTNHVGTPRQFTVNALYTNSALPSPNFVGNMDSWQLCSHIFIAGSSQCEVDDAACDGASADNVQNIFVALQGAATAPLATTFLSVSDNVLRNLRINNVCIGIGTCAQDHFLFENIFSDKYSQVSQPNCGTCSFPLADGNYGGAYGPGHVIYAYGTTPGLTMGTIRGVVDQGTPLESWNTGTGQTMTLKNVSYVRVSDVYSARREGAIVLGWCTHVDVEFQSLDFVLGGPPLSFLSTVINGVTLFNTYLKVRGTIVQTVAEPSAKIVDMSGCASGSDNLYCELDLTLIHFLGYSDSAPYIFWVGNNGVARITQITGGPNLQKITLYVANVSQGNNFYFRSLGTSPSPCLTMASGSGNTFWISGDYDVNEQITEFNADANNNSVIWESARQYQSTRYLGSVSNPFTATFKLPASGAYLVDVNLIDSAGTDACAGLFWVLIDSASTGPNATMIQQIGLFVPKGTAPSFALSAASTGIVTVAGSAAGTPVTWNLNYGYRQLSSY